MTHEEIRSMVPGPEMDRLVAKEVMGFVTYEDFPVHAVYTGSPTPTSFRPWQPSNNIAAAWEVVHKVKNIQIQRKANGNFTVRWNIERFNGWNVVESPSAPEAICKAALLAVMEG